VAVATVAIFSVVVIGPSSRASVRHHLVTEARRARYPDVLGDIRRRAEGAPRRDRGRAQTGRRGTAKGELTERETMTTETPSESI